MRLSGRLLALLALPAVTLLAGVAPPVRADVPLSQRKAEWLGTPELMRSMRQGGYVVYFRHGLTNWSEKLREQQNNATRRFDLANCASQRNLSEEGRAEARMIGFSLSAMRIPVGKVFASQYCRPAEHVAIIAGRQPDERVFWLTGLGRPETLPRLRERVSTPPEPGTNVILGDHGDLIYNVTDWVIEEGDAVVFRPEPPSFRFIAWIRPHEWLDLARQLEAAEQSDPGPIARVEFDGEVPIGLDDARTLLGGFVGASGGVDRRFQAAATLERALRTRGFGTYDVLPADRGEVAVLRLTVRRNVIGRVNVAESKDYSAAHARAALPALVEGSAPATDALARQRLAASANPARTIDVLFRRGSAPGRLDADIAVSGAPPLSGQVAIDNAGTASTGRVRLGIGASHANVFDQGHVIAAAVGVAPGHAAEHRQAGLSYTIPVPHAAGAITGYFARSTVGFGTLPGVAAFTGPGHFGGVRYRHQLTPRGDYSSELTLGLEDKSYSGADLPAPVRARPLALGYSGHWEGQWTGWNYGFEFVRNLESGSGNDDATYARVRSHANAGWSALRGHADFTRILTYDLRLILRARAQLARSPLIGGEQIALGGALSAWSGWPWGGVATARGFDERSVSGDSGFVAGAEFWSRRLFGHDLRAGLFVDTGYVRREDSDPGVRASDTVTSVGAGLRYRLDRRVEARLDLAHVLRGTEERERGSNRVFVAFRLLDW